MTGDLFGEQPVSLGEQIREVERELRMRERVYPRHIQSGQMTKATAERQTRALEAVRATLRGLV